MIKKIILESGRGTKLYRTKNTSQKIQIVEDSNLPQNYTNILVILGDKLSSLESFIVKNKLQSIKTNKNQEYMVINLSKNPITVVFHQDPEHDIILYDPYLYEKEKHIDITPESFKKDHPNFRIPDGYIDTLCKWYSIKFTYPKENYIFIKPKLGISIQSHKLRSETWEILMGSPIILSGNTLYYNTEPGDIFCHPLGGFHTIINPTDNWVLIKETYQGTFDEKDIVRVFNPNDYK
jgi:mannose-6-phosphate isomerase-like protein (cupin superfamily)